MHLSPLVAYLVAMLSLLAVATPNVASAKAPSPANAGRDAIPEAPESKVVDGAPGRIPTVDARPVAPHAIEDAIQIWQQLGDEAELAKWRAYRLAPPAGDDIERMEDFLNDLRKSIQALRHRSEYLPAQQLLRSALILSEANKETLPKRYGGIQFEAAMIDYAFERYDSAVIHLMQCQSVLSGETPLSSRVERSFRAGQADMLHKQGRYAESLEIYSKLLQELQNDRNAPTDEVSDLRVALANLHIDMGHLKEAREVMPHRIEEFLDENGQIDGSRQMRILSACARIKLQENDTKKALLWAEGVVEHAKRGYGVASLEYVDAIELVCKVMTHESRYEETAELLAKSADIRARLLGNDHPSVQRTLKQVDSIRRVQLQDSTAVRPVESTYEVPAIANRPETGASAGNKSK